MRKLPRRAVLGWGLGLAASRALGTAARAYEPAFKPERDAAMRLLRWSGFVKSDEELWNANTKKFTDATGVKVSVEYITWEDVRPKAALAANLGTGPDIVMGWYDDPHIYPQKLLDVSDLAERLGKDLGGWYEVARTYGYSRKMKHWIAVPIGGTVECLNYRTSWMKEAGFEEFPKTPADLLKLAKALKAKGHPVGFALGHAVGDGNNWTHWLLCTFGGKAVEKDNKTIAIGQKPALEAFEYAQEPHAQMAPALCSWLQPNNHTAF